MTTNQAQRQDQGIAPTGYQALRGDMKKCIRGAQVRAALSVNHTLITLYGEIGRAIGDRQEEHGWGARVITRFSVRLRRPFPDMTGFSPRTLTGSIPIQEIAQHLLRDVPWGHIAHLLGYVPDPTARDQYTREAVTRGWATPPYSMPAVHEDTAVAAASDESRGYGGGER